MEYARDDIFVIGSSNSLNALANQAVQRRDGQADTLPMRSVTTRFE